MTETYVFERAVVLICQCLKPCHMPFKDAETGEWSQLGCLRTVGHEPPCSLDAPDGGFAYRDPPEAIGPRVVMRRREPDSRHYDGKCPQCLREYTVTVASFSSDEAATLVPLGAIAPNYDDDEVIVDGPDTPENRRWGPVR